MPKGFIGVARATLPTFMDVRNRPIQADTRRKHWRNDRVLAVRVLIMEALLITFVLVGSFAGACVRKDQRDRASLVHGSAARHERYGSRWSSPLNGD